MTPHDWLDLANNVGASLFGIVFVFCIFGGIGATERIIRERARRKDARRRREIEESDKLWNRTQYLIERKEGGQS